MEIKLEYKGFEIHYEESDNEWVVFASYSRIGRYKSLKTAKEAADRRIKEASKIEPFNAYIPCGRYENDYRKVKITSINEKGEAWITDGNKNRSKHDGEIYKDTPENEAAIAEIHALNKEISKLDVKRSHLKYSLEQVEISEFFKKPDKEESNDKNRNS